MFVCFAPKENPKIAIAVCVQNAGYGATWGGPIARILIEKYLNDTIQKKSEADVDRISKANLIPAHYKRLQYKADSSRAWEWFKMTKDSSYIKKFRRNLVDTSRPKPPAPGPADKQKRITTIWLQDEKRNQFLLNPKPA